MSRFRFYILPRLCLGLSVLFLLFGGWVLWLSLDRPLPTVGLACRQAETAAFLPHGQLIASGSAALERGSSRTDRWAVLRSGGNTYALANLDRRAGLLWTAEVHGSFQLEDTGLLGLMAANDVIWDGDDFRPGGFDVQNIDAFTETLPLAICTDPSVVRLEGEFLVLGGWEDPEQARRERAVPVTWHDCGNGVWVGDAVVAILPEVPGEAGHAGGMSALWCRGYDADGNLVCAYDPTADWPVPSTE